MSGVQRLQLVVERRVLHRLQHAVDDDVVRLHEVVEDTLRVDHRVAIRIDYSKALSR